MRKNKKKEKKGKKGKKRKKKKKWGNTHFFTMYINTAIFQNKI